MVRITTGSYKVISASWADTLPRTRLEARATFGSEGRSQSRSDATRYDKARCTAVWRSALGPHGLYDGNRYGCSDVSHAWAYSRSAPHITSGVSRAVAMAYTQRIKPNLVVPARCEPKSALCASAINRHVDRALDPLLAERLDDA